MQITEITINLWRNSGYEFDPLRKVNPDITVKAVIEPGDNSDEAWHLLRVEAERMMLDMHDRENKASAARQLQMLEQQLPQLQRQIRSMRREQGLPADVTEIS